MSITEVGEDGVEINDQWEDLLGTGTVLKQVLVKGNRKRYDDDDDDDGIDMEAPRKFFALIDIETECNGQLISSESHKNFLLNVDADLFPGAHLVIPLMDINETSLYKLDSKFCYCKQGLPESDIPSNSKLTCKITLKLRSQYDTFLEQMSTNEKVQLASRKKERGKFWYSRGNYQNAISIYQSILDLCQDLDSTSNEVDEISANLAKSNLDATAVQADDNY